ncbi:hypothetical protein SALBM311S_11669 [Streptomyces alboniger]
MRRSGPRPRFARRSAADSRHGVAAGQIIAVRRILALDNWRRSPRRSGSADVKGDAVAAAERAFGQLAVGLPHLA